MSSQYIRNRIVSDALSTTSLSRFLLEAEDKSSFAFDFDQYKSDEQRKIKSAFSATIKTFDELIGFISKLEPTGIKKEKRGLFKNTLAMLKIGRTNLARAMSNLDDITNIERFWAAQQFLFSFSNLLNGLADAVKELQGGDEAAKSDATLGDAMGKDLLLVAKRKFFPTSKQRQAVQRMVDFFSKNDDIAHVRDRANVASRGKTSMKETEKIEEIASKMLQEVEAGEERNVVGFLKNLFSVGTRPAVATMAPLFGKQPYQIAEIIVSDLKTLRLIDFDNMMGRPGLSKIFADVQVSSKSIDAKAMGTIDKPRDPGIEKATINDDADDTHSLAFNRGMARTLRKALYKRGKDSIINRLIDMFDVYNDFEEHSLVLKKMQKKPELYDRLLKNQDSDNVPEQTIDATNAAADVLANREKLTSLWDLFKRDDKEGLKKGLSQLLGFPVEKESKYFDRDVIIEILEDLQKLNYEENEDKEKIDDVLNQLNSMFDEKFEKEKIYPFYDRVLKNNPENPEDAIVRDGYDDVKQIIENPKEGSYFKSIVGNNVLVDDISKEIEKNIIKYFKDYQKAKEKESEKASTVSETAVDRWTLLAGLAD